MRQIRHDHPGKSDSFKIAKSDSMSSSMESVAGYLRAGGFWLVSLRFLVHP